MTTPPLPSDPNDLAIAAGEAAAEVLPAATPLVAGGAQPGTEHVVSSFAGAAVAEVAGSRIAVLVGDELVAALEASPLGGLDLAAAVQPALDAVAAVLGGSAQAATQVELTLVVSDLGGPFTVVPLIGSGIAAALLLPDALLAPGAAASAGPGAGPTVTAPVASGAVPVGAAPVRDLGPGAPVHGGGHGSSVIPLAHRGIEMLHGVDMEVTVELGRTRMAVRDLLALAPGAVLELDRAAGSPADLLVNGRLIARGEVVVVDEDFGLRVTEILDDQAAS
ncbi:flagellar motor switch protein FliN [Nocardioides sp.]|uniref:flagellar motor switch protein FliN n=1 Tax=Nocardioides sp. TaxID=35761 RepID=UPI00286D1881|nr:flagellar motor switch protein FliN [Nocardioides sp.]